MLLMFLAVYLTNLGPRTLDLLYNYFLFFERFGGSPGGTPGGPKIIKNR